MTDKDAQERSELPPCPLRPWIRSRPIRAMFRSQEYADLQEIAEGWGVPPATAVWAIVCDQLARWRHRAPELGPHGLAISAALVILRQGLEAEPGGGRVRPVPDDR